MDDLLFNVTQEKIDYYKLRNHFTQIANQRYENTLSSFELFFKDIEDIHENYQEFIGFKISELSGDIEKYFIDRGIYDFDLRTFVEHYVKPVFIDYFQEVDDQYLEIVMTAEELDEYRTQRRLNRGKYHGFTLEGHTKAFAANLAMGALHGTFNLGAKALSSMVNSVKKKNLYTNIENRKLLAEGLRQTIIQIHYSIAEAINDELDEVVFDILQQDSIDRANRLFLNVKNGKVPTDKIPDVVCECIYLYPINKEYYDFLYMHYPSARAVINNTSLQFGLKGYPEENRTENQKNNSAELEDLTENQQNKSISAQKNEPLIVESNSVVAELAPVANTDVTVKKQSTEVKANTAVKELSPEVKTDTVVKQQSSDAVSDNSHNTENLNATTSSNTQVQVSHHSAEHKHQRKPESEENEADHLNNDVWNNKSKPVLLLLSFFLGSLGVHKFYAGNWGWGIIYLALFTTGASFLFSMIEFIHIIFMSKDSFDKKYNKRRIKAFTFTW